MGMTPITLTAQQQLAVVNALSIDPAYVQADGVEMYRTDDPERVAIRVTIVGTLDAGRLADAL